MKRAAFRRAVSGIRWSEQQRQAITERLLQQPGRADDAIDDGTEAFFETDMLSMEDVRYGEDIHMGKLHSRKMLWIAAIAAAALTAGGTAAAVAMRRSGEFDSSDLTDRIEPVTELHLNLTDDEYVQAGYIRYSEPVAVSENGWYYHKHRYVNKTEEQYQDPDFDEAKYEAYRKSRELNALYYKDAETGEEVPLCARANCLHNGDDFCPASTGLYITGELRYYDGALYAFGSKRVEQKEGFDYYEGYYLLRYEPDGTGITELTQFDFSGEDVYGTTPVIHRGYVFGVFRSVIDKGEPIENPITGDLMNHSTSGYVIAGYELATGKTVTLYSSLPQSGTGYNYTNPDFLTASGDSLYYSIPSYATWPNENLGGVYSIDLRTGEHKKLALDGEYIYHICPVGDLLLYEGSTGSVSTWYLYDCKTGESTALESYSNLMSANDGGFAKQIVTDGTYIYVEHFHTDPKPISEIEIYDMEMNLLSRTEYGEGLYLCDLMVQDGYLYTQVTGTTELLNNGKGGWEVHSGESHDLFRCSVDDLLRGKADWAYVLTTTEQEVYGDAD